MKLLKSLFVVAVVAVLVVTATRSFFSDTEESTGNLFEAGAIDLKVSSQGSASWSEHDNNVGRWVSSDLEPGMLFFNFQDMKPGDWGENTIDLTVVNNDSWLCAGITKTGDYENDVAEPEGEPLTDLADSDGELDKYLELAWWKDNGNNILDSDESLLWIGPASLADWLLLAGGDTLPLTFADSVHNWTGVSGPIEGNEPQYLGVVWCFGDLTYVSGGEVVCDGSGYQNDSQTDSITGTLSFEAVQSRNNEGFLCPEHRPIAD